MVADMARTARTISCGPDDRQQLQRMAGSRTESKQIVERAQIILGCLDGKRVNQVAGECRTRSNTVIKWRERFAHLHGGVNRIRARIVPFVQPETSGKYRFVLPHTTGDELL